MNLTILKNMIKEEFRLHSSLYNRRNIIAFPLTLMVLSFLGFLLFSSTSGIDFISFSKFFLITSFVVGLTTGSIELNASDFLEKRFGDYGKLFFNSLLLPIRLSKLFIITAIADIIFYLLWFILPIIMGFVIYAIFFLNFNIPFMLILSTIVLAFVSLFIGILISFLLILLMKKSKIISISFFALLIFLIISFNDIILYFLLPSITFVNNFNFNNLIYTVIYISVLLIGIYLAVGNEYSTKVKLKKEKKSTRISTNSPIISKDIIELKRSFGFIIRPIFGVIIPSLLILLMINSLKDNPYFAIYLNMSLYILGIIMAVFATSFFNGIVLGDSASHYKFIPVSFEKLMRSKLSISFVTNAVYGLISLFIFGFFINFDSILDAMLLFISVLIYSLSINFFINGIRPEENSLAAKNLILNFFLFMPYIIASIVFATVFKGIIWSFLVYLLMTFAISYAIYILAIRKWKKYF